MTLEEAKNNCKKGWKLNPNTKIVNGIIKGINRCNGECPCNNNSEDKHCPCSNYRYNSECCCTLYVRNTNDEELFRIKQVKRKEGQLNN